MHVRQWPFNPLPVVSHFFYLAISNKYLYFMLEALYNNLSMHFASKPFFADLAFVLSHVSHV